MPLDLRPDLLAMVHGILRRRVPDREVWAFGSRVNGTAKQWSDLDLMIMGEQPLDLATLGELQYDFSESDLPYLVDVTDGAMAEPWFRQLVEAEHVVVQRAGALV